MTQPPLCYPQRLAHPSRPPRSDLHPTAGLPGNWALDFMAAGGTPVVAPQAAVVSRLSGHPPADYHAGSSIFGWSVYLTTSGGVVYFCTHLGERVVSVGEHVKLGQLLGHVGHWPNDPGRSHTHLGITHPAGILAAQARILAVARAPVAVAPPF